MSAGRGTKFGSLLLAGGLAFLAPICVYGVPAAQQTPLSADSSNQPHRTRLIMKDGSYQIVMSYRVVGRVVHYISAERGGDEEEVPVKLVDFKATRRWAQEHVDPLVQDGGGAPQPPAIDPELLKEEAERASFTPEVAKDLHLPEEDSTLILDTYHSTPELIPLAQTDSDLNRITGHNVLRAAINPRSSAHKIVELKGETSEVQVHVASPVIYLRIGDEASPPSGDAPFKVETHGATSYVKDEPGGGSAKSTYVIVRTDVRTDARVIDSFQIGLLGTGQQQVDVDETKTELLPGGHWLKITPLQPLDFGEYALMEVISDKAVNLGVWDFGVHPVAPEDRDAIKPEPQRPLILQPRRPG